MSELFPLSVVVLAKNEAINIPRCLTSLQWCDDVVVVDDLSTDETRELAVAAGARVLSHPFESFAAQRNWALQQGELKNEWVLLLDADEVCTTKLQMALIAAVKSAGENIVGFKMCRKTMFLGRWLKRTDGFPVWIMRMVRRDRAWFIDQGHGEVPVPDVDGELGTIREPFIHYPFSHGISHWVRRHCDYATREAELEMKHQQPLRCFELLSFDSSKRRTALRALSRRVPARPVFRFLYQYIWKGGFLEGRGGLAFSTLMAFYESLIIIKRWELQLRAKGEEL